MKIHLDYLEGRVEELEMVNSIIEQKMKESETKLKEHEEKFKALQLEKDTEKKEYQSKNQNLQERLTEVQ